jgi:hypothetical protein
MPWNYGEVLGQPRWSRFRITCPRSEYDPHLGKLSIAVREVNRSRVTEKQFCRKAKSPKGF